MLYQGWAFNHSPWNWVSKPSSSSLSRRRPSDTGESGLNSKMETITGEGEGTSSGTLLSTSFSSPSAYKVGHNDDLLSEILIRLPVRYIIRSKLVSKHWLSLITNPRFSVQFCKQNPNPNPPSGLFFKRLFNDCKSKYGFIPFDINSPVKKNPFKDLKLDREVLCTVVLQCCNGLMLCQGQFDHRKYKYYVFNPTIKQVFTLPDTDWNPSRVHGMDFVFDPSKSPHYKVLCIRSLKPYKKKAEYFPSKTVIDIYSSETRKWRVCSQPFDLQYFTTYCNGVYCNDAIHWYDPSRRIWCYKFDEECVCQIQAPRLPDVNDEPHPYILESCGSLLFIDVFPCSSAFDVWEMKKDYSGWFVKYHVDIDQVAKAFPVMVGEEGTEGRFQFGIQSIILEGREDDSFIVLELPVRMQVVTWEALQSLSNYSLCLQLHYKQQAVSRNFKGGHSSGYQSPYFIIKQISLVWSPPPAGTLKMNSDGAARGNPGFGGILTDELLHPSFQWILGKMELQLPAELQAIHQLLPLIDRLGLHGTMLEAVHWMMKTSAMITFCAPS